MRMWLDTEFNGFAGELISLALVDESGREWYEVVPCANPVPWVATNVIPFLGKQPTSIASVRNSLAGWLRSYDRVHVIADWPADFVHFCELLLSKPGFRIATPPLSMELVEGLLIESAIPHNALEDAKALRAVHLGIDRFSGNERNRAR
jgi:hypothetical protein